MAGTDTSRKTPFSINDLKTSVPTPGRKETSSSTHSTPPSRNVKKQEPESDLSDESEEDSGIDTEQESEEDVTEHNEIGMGVRFEKGRVEDAKKLHPMFDVIHDWMISYRPARKVVPSEQEIERARERLDWDDAPDGLVGEIPRKILTPEEAVCFENFRATPRTMSISPEDRFRKAGENEPSVWLMIEPERVGSEWRKTFNPEEYCVVGSVGKLVRNRPKQQLLQAYSNRTDSAHRGFDYWAHVRVVARRLLRAGGSKSQLRPNRPLYESFKEIFFHNRQARKSADQRAWFFAHVRQVMMRLKDRFVMKSYRPWEDPEIDMGASSEEDEENDAYVVVPPGTTEEVPRSDFWGGEPLGAFAQVPAPVVTSVVPMNPDVPVSRTRKRPLAGGGGEGRRPAKLFDTEPPKVIPLSMPGSDNGLMEIRSKEILRCLGG